VNRRLRRRTADTTAPRPRPHRHHDRTATAPPSRATSRG